MRKLRRIIVFVLTIMMFTNVLLVNAKEDVSAFPWEEQIKTTAEDWPSGPEIDAETAILIEASTGTILYQKDMHKQMYPASITKILTTLVALEHIDSYEDIITFSHDSVFSIERGSTHIGMNEDEQLTVDQCLYAVMLASANECSYALGEFTAGGNYEKFIQMMNDKASELGAQNSHFANAHGLPDENHYTSAYDMALIAREAFTIEKFRDVASTYTYTIPGTNLTDEVRYLANHHKMLPQKSKPYEGCLGGKTGYTQAAGNTLVTYAERDGLTLIAVVLRSSIYPDTEKLLDYGFDQYKAISIRDNDTSDYAALLKETPITGDESGMYLTMADDGTVVLPKDVDFSEVTATLTTSVTSEDYLGTLIYTYNGQYVGYVDLKGQNDENAAGTLGQIYEPEDEPEENSEDAETSDQENTGNSSSKSSVKLVITIIILVILIAAALLVPKYFHISKK